MSGPSIRASFRPEPVVYAPPVSRAARVLALAHHVERLVEEGALASYAKAAEQLGLTRARLTQILALTLLAPEVQERIAVGELEVSPRMLRRAVGEAAWGTQRAVTTELEEGAARTAGNQSTRHGDSRRAAIHKS